MKKANKVNGAQLIVNVLKKLGNERPTQDEIELAESLLLRATINYKMIFHRKLTHRESSCLLLAAKGRTIEETANIMNVKPSTVKTWRNNVINKLGCTSIAQAVFEGISFGYVPKKIKHPTFDGSNP